MSFRWLIDFTVQRSLHMRLIDVVTTYLYDDLDKDIYMKMLGSLPATIGYSFTYAGANIENKQDTCKKTKNTETQDFNLKNSK